ncbi:MAG TPA: CehA/McbA family metallohydrolase [Terriglobales bacterium]|nr:CehA/McbA family metallohydrolase [Terriglobales bacterium]
MGQRNPDLILRGEVNPNQIRTYVKVPFDVPQDIERLTVAFHYTGKDQHVVLDLGIEDPRGFRGWSGGNKDTFTIGESDATPSYIPGRIEPGRWNLLIGVPNIRQAASSYEVKIYFSHRQDHGLSAGFAEGALRTGESWYRGDLHMHTGHSDGRCTSQAGHEVPCPVFVTAEAAVRRGLDFIAITDHNTTSQSDSLRELQPYFDRLLFISGREATTFQGHANVFGTTEPLDFRVGSDTVPNINILLKEVHQAGGLISINHPNAPTGEVCMGCGWTPNPAADLKLIDAVEAVNGGAEGTPYDGLPFWEAQLNRGFRLTAIGGSDNHRPETPFEKPGSIGSPTTVVRAPELSTTAILEAIRRGHVFIDLTGSRDRLLEVEVSANGHTAIMGDELDAPAGVPVEFAVHVAHCEGSSVRMTIDGNTASLAPAKKISETDETIHYTWNGDGVRHWVRADVVSPEEKIELLGNPIYLNSPRSAQVHESGSVSPTPKIEGQNAH